MEMNIRSDRKLVEIWLSNGEKSNPITRMDINGICDKYKKQNYLVAVFESGSENLFQNTLDLLVYNRKRTAEKEVRERKPEYALQ